MKVQYNTNMTLLPYKTNVFFNYVINLQTSFKTSVKTLSAIFAPKKIKGLVNGPRPN